MIDALVEADHGIERVLLHPHHVSGMHPHHVSGMEVRHYAALARAVGPGKRIRALDLRIGGHHVQAKLEAFSKGLQAGGSLIELKLDRTRRTLDRVYRGDPDVTSLLAALAQKCPKLESLILDDIVC